MQKRKNVRMSVEARSVYIERRLIERDRTLVRRSERAAAELSKGKVAA
jgi:hypothetical protein